MEIIKIFLASSEELAEDRIGFQLLIAQLNQDWISKGIFFSLVIWENFIDALSKDGLQSEYNKAIKESDIFVLLFFTKVGRFSKEEFESAFGSFSTGNKPIIYTYFKDDLILTGDIGHEIISLLEFKETLNKLGHYYTRYRSIEDLKWQFSKQLERLFSNTQKNLLEITDKSTQAEIDTIALTFTNKILTDPNQQIDTQKINDVIAKSSEITKNTIFLLASKVRRDNWKSNKDIMERVIPLFKALVESDVRKEKYYYYGQLGYVLKDQRNPDWDSAKKYFDIAINIIGEHDEYSDYYYYDFNRAICLVKTDPQFSDSKPSKAETKKLILKDLRTFKDNYPKFLENLLRQQSNKAIVRWMQINKVKVI